MRRLSNSHRKELIEWEKSKINEEIIFLKKEIDKHNQHIIILRRQIFELNEKINDLLDRLDNLILL